MPNSWNVLQIMDALPALRPGSEGRSFRECRSSLRLLLHAVKIDGCPSIFPKKINKFTFLLGYMHQVPARYLGKKVKKQCKEVLFFH